MGEHEGGMKRAGRRGGFVERRRGGAGVEGVLEIERVHFMDGSPCECRREGMWHRIVYRLGMIFLRFMMSP